MLRKEEFVPGQYYHIYNRTVFNLPEFKNIKSAERLIHAFLLANSDVSTSAFRFLRNNPFATIKDAWEIIEDSKKLVDVLCYVIMPNHYHLLLKERVDGGISSFVHKCNISIAKYINTKKERKGPLFESLFKSKHISTNEYLLHLSLYIHLNPLDFLKGKAWRAHGSKNWTEAKKKLLDYPWSSLRTFLDKSCEDKVLSGTEIISGQFENSREYERFLRDWSIGDTVKLEDRDVFID